MQEEDDLDSVNKVNNVSGLITESSLPEGGTELGDEADLNVNGNHDELDNKEDLLKEIVD